MPNLAERFSVRVSGVLRRLADKFAAEAKPADSTELGYAGSSSPTLERFLQHFQVEYDRRSVIRDIHRMMADDPRVAEANDQLVQMALRSGIRVQVTSPANGGGALAGLGERAQAVIDRVRKTNKLDSRLNSWARKLVEEGDLFVQRIVADGELIAHKRMPAISMVRNTDLSDRFTNPQEAFLQKDVNSDQVVASFALWQIIHVRWHNADGNRYGESQYLQIRRISRALQAAQDDLMVRRRTRAPQRILWNIGTADRPGSPTDIEEFKKLNGIQRRDDLGRLQQATDIYGNGFLDAKVLGGDATLGDVGDLIYLQNAEFARLGVPKAFLGAEERVPREVVQEQREQSQRAVDALQVVIAELLRGIYDFALLLEGINPESIEYVIRFQRELSSAVFDKLKAVTMLWQQKVPLITLRTAVRILAPELGIENPDEEVEAILEFMREQRQPPVKKTAEAALTGVNPANLTGATTGGAKPNGGARAE